MIITLSDSEIEDFVRKKYKKIPFDKDRERKINADISEMKAIRDENKEKINQFVKT